MTPSPVQMHCEGGRCYMLPEGEFSLGPDFGDTVPCTVPELRDEGPDR